MHLTFDCFKSVMKFLQISSKFSILLKLDFMILFLKKIELRSPTNHPPPISFKNKIFETIFFNCHKKKTKHWPTSRRIPNWQKTQTKVKRTSDIFIKKPVRIPEIFETHCNRTVTINVNHSFEHSYFNLRSLIQRFCLIWFFV